MSMNLPFRVRDQCKDNTRYYLTELTSLFTGHDSVSGTRLSTGDIEMNEEKIVQSSEVIDESFNKER